MCLCSCESLHCPSFENVLVKSELDIGSDMQQSQLGVKCQWVWCRLVYISLFILLCFLNGCLVDSKRVDCSESEMQQLQFGVECHLCAENFVILICQVYISFLFFVGFRLGSLLDWSYGCKLVPNGKWSLCSYMVISTKSVRACPLIIPCLRSSGALECVFISIAICSTTPSINHESILPAPCGTKILCAPSRIFRGKLQQLDDYTHPV